MGTIDYAAILLLPVETLALSCTLISCLVWTVWWLADRSFAVGKLEYLILVFTIALLGGVAGYAGGLSRVGVVGDIIPAALSLVGGVSIYIFGISKEKNIELYRKVTDLFNSNKLDELDTYIEENYTEHTPDPSGKSGLLGLKEQMKNFRKGFPDLKFTIIDIISENGMVWAHVNTKGKNTGTMMGMPPTNKVVDFNGVDIIKIKNGKATDHWGYFAEHVMMEQLGLFPGQEPAPEKNPRK